MATSLGLANLRGKVQALQDCTLIMATICIITLDSGGSMAGSADSGELWLEPGVGPISSTCLSRSRPTRSTLVKLDLPVARANIYLDLDAKLAVV